MHELQLALILLFLIGWKVRFGMHVERNDILRIANMDLISPEGLTHGCRLCM